LRARKRAIHSSESDSQKALSFVNAVRLIAFYLSDTVCAVSKSQPCKEDRLMKKLLLALIAAGFASATVGALAADEKPYTAQPKVEKPGRAADDGSGSSTVKSGGDTMKPGRAADDAAAPTDKPKKKKKKKADEPK
jgi:hypothetical protein